MKLEQWAVMYTARCLTSLLCKIDDRSLNLVPLQGPLILVCNHINSLEVPVVITRLHPRPVTAFAKSETWDNPILGPLFSMWDAIPIQRGEPDITALRNGMRALEKGKIVAITPEGTRSGNGHLQKGHPGVVTLGLHSGAPILPMVYYGGEAFTHNVRRLRRTDFRIRVGQQFQLVAHGGRVTTDVRRKIIDEIMFQLAMLLPSQYRGVYNDLSAASAEFLRF